MDFPPENVRYDPVTRMLAGAYDDHGKIYNIVLLDPRTCQMRVVGNFSMALGLFADAGAVDSLHRKYYALCFEQATLNPVLVVADLTGATPVKQIPVAFTVAPLTLWLDAQNQPWLFGPNNREDGLYSVDVKTGAVARFGDISFPAPIGVGGIVVHQASNLAFLQWKNTDVFHRSAGISVVDLRTKTVVSALLCAVPTPGNRAF